jgi:acyl-CoA synthetase (AMP-forming)/AMP-acid ligase II
LVDSVQRLAAGLAGLGLHKSDILAVQMPTRLATIQLHAAAAWLGVTVLPIIHIYEGAELAFILEQSGAKALVSPSAWRKVDFAARRARLAQDFPNLLQIVEGPASAGEVSLESLLVAEPMAKSVAVSPEDIAMLIYTSGTTSQPKGVQHSHASLLAELAADHGKRGSLVQLAPWPPGHVAGVLTLLRFWAMAQNSVYLESWDAHIAARLIEHYGVQASSGTPFHIASLLDAAAQDGRDISSLTDYMAGATMIPPALIQRCQDAGLATYRCYGLSEHPTISCGSPDDPLDKRLGTDGRLNPGVELRIVDDLGCDQPPEAPGEIWSRGPDRFVGYFDSSRNAEALTPDGWLKTGDIGVLDAEGYLSITDRKKDIIIRGGENIASREVEDLLMLIPGVRDAAVVGAPDARLGERVAAFVVADPDTDLSIAAIARHFVGHRVALQKSPEFVQVVADLPRNAAGKVLKPVLREKLRS